MFNKLFDPIIEDYHKGYQPDAIHPYAMEIDYLDDIPPFTEEQASFIKSTRFRVSRNLAGFPLEAGLSEEERMDILTQVLEASDHFHGYLEGEFYPVMT